VSDSEILKQILKNQTEGHGERLAVIETRLTNVEAAVKTRASQHDMANAQQKDVNLEAMMRELVRDASETKVLANNIINITSVMGEIKDAVTKIGKDVSNLQTEVITLTVEKQTRFKDLGAASKILLWLSGTGIIAGIGHYIYSSFGGK
jgi:hypothetical protein